MDIRPSTSQERRLLFLESLLNSTDKVSKVSDNSVLTGLAEGVAKITGKAEKDIVLAISTVFPSLSSGSSLDGAAKNFGFTTRLGASASTTYVRVTGTIGTTYTPSTHFFISTAGVQFAVETQVVIGAAGFAYVPVVSTITGANANVDPLTISQVSPVPTGHTSCVNEYAAINGADVETDEIFRTRVADGGNILARSTLAMINAICTIINPKVLRVFNYGINLQGKRKIAVATQSGEILNQTELDQLQASIGPFLGLADSRWWGTSYVGVVFVNVIYQPVDISFRVQLDNSANPDDVRRSIQLAISKFFDFRTFDPISGRIQWVDLIEIAKSVNGVKYMPDQYFFPNADVSVNVFKLPRLRGFLMLDLNGTVISNLTGTLSPVYYPAQADFAYQSTVLQMLT